MKTPVVFTCLALVATSAFAQKASPQIIVDWGHDWGTGFYRQTPAQQVNGAWQALDQRDLNGNGTTEDDWVGGWGYRYDIPLTPTNAIYDTSFPSANFYGAAIVRVTDLPPKEEGGYHKAKAPSEGHINQNHELRDDWNLMAIPAVKRHPELHQLDAAMLAFWKKEDFLNGGDQYPVSLPEGSAIGIFISRYWGGIDWGRWVVQDSGQFYISEDTFAGQTNPFGLDLSLPVEQAEAKPNGAKNPVVRTTNTIDPTKTRWAPYHPAAPDDVFFDVENADFQPRAFNNVEAVGFLAQRDLAPGYPVAAGLWKMPYGLGEPIALKFNAAQVRAVVGSPDNYSPVVTMVPVPSSSAPALYVAQTETTYRQWAEVWKWAVTNQRASNFTAGFESLELPGYIFIRDGAPGSAETGLAESHSVREPVTSITWHDAVAWCNALSELEGRRPAYYEDAAFTRPLRSVMERLHREQRDERPVVYWDASAPGYRLPTGAEFAYLYNEGGASAGWTPENAGQRTHPVAKLNTDRFGLHDLSGNVAEYIWPTGDHVDPADGQGYWAAGGSFADANGLAATSLLPFGEEPARGSPVIGFRVVRNGTGSLPTSDSAGVPRVNTKPGQRLPSSRQIDPATLARLAQERMGEHVFSDAGSLPTNDNPSRNYKPEETYAIAVSETEIPYWLWNGVRQWAEAQGGYHFNHAGDLGNLTDLSPATTEAVHHRDEPVTNMTWYDAVVWCNALSELTGREPVYLDKDTGEPLRDASTPRLPMYREYHYMNLGGAHDRPVDDAAVINLETNTAANGYRLPTFEEMEAAATPSKNLDEAWLRANSEGQTHPVATREPNASGLHDTEGNVHEWNYGGDRLFGQNRYGTHYADEPGVPPHGMNRKDSFFVGRPYLGFRPVWRPE